MDETTVKVIREELNRRHPAKRIHVETTQSPVSVKSEAVPEPHEDMRTVAARVGSTVEVCQGFEAITYDPSGKPGTTVHVVQRF